MIQFFSPPTSSGLHVTDSNVVFYASPKKQDLTSIMADLRYGLSKVFTNNSKLFPVLPIGHTKLIIEGQDYKIDQHNVLYKNGVEVMHTEENNLLLCAFLYTGMEYHLRRNTLSNLSNIGYKAIYFDTNITDDILEANQDKIDQNVKHARLLFYQKMINNSIYLGYAFDFIKNGTELKTEFVLNRLVALATVKNPTLDFSEFKNIRGIVTIDNFDDNLSMVAQSVLVETLRSIFPNVQFFVSLNSPIALGTTKNALVYRVETSHDNTHLTRHFCYGKTFDEILFDVFHCDSREKTLQLKLDKLRVLADEDPTSPLFDELMKEMEGLLGTYHSAINTIKSLAEYTKEYGSIHKKP